ncbi:uroporphyrinogen decarboxylase/cobalamine-independent methonine synthase family protein [Sphaerisporangium aureirubrum]|uniref:Cobalamin-independent methionine synthase MetE C-terminal/archaeal domain-containing protein n=1 Tax=Sphaerisporangium aureirubrum TaxID=1544736 RepID=A0ABW1NLQ1_9ACTN
MGAAEQAELLGRLPPLPTTVVGSHPVPEWMERLKTDYYRGRMSHAHLLDLHETAIKAALRDQELAGIDIVSDGELRRDNDIDHFLGRMPGVDIPRTSKDFYYDYYEAAVTAPLPAPERDGGPLGLADDFAFTTGQTAHPVKFSFTGPFSLSRRVRNEAYPDSRELVLAIARTLNAEARALAGRGARLLQIDEPFLAGYPDQVRTAVEAVNVVTEGVDVAWALHVCYGNRHARPSWEGHYDFLFPAVLDARVDQLVLEFARKGYADLPAIGKFGWDRAVGLGVIDVKSAEVESPALVAARVRGALDLVPADRLFVNPDCGLRNLTGATARAKLAAMVAGTALVRSELTGTAPPITVGGAPTAQPSRSPREESES